MTMKEFCKYLRNQELGMGLTSFGVRVRGEEGFLFRDREAVFIIFLAFRSDFQ